MPKISAMEQLGNVDNEGEEKKWCRRPNFTPNEVKALLSGYEKRKNIFIPKLSSGLTSAMKRDSWASLLREVNATSSNCRTVEEIKRKMKDIKKINKQKASKNKRQLEKTRSSPSGNDALDPFFFPRVLQIVGETSINGIDGSVESILGEASQSSNSEMSLDLQVDINADEINGHTVESSKKHSSSKKHNTVNSSAKSVTQEWKEIEVQRLGVLKNISSDLKLLVKVQQSILELKKAKYASSRYQLRNSSKS